MQLEDGVFLKPCIVVHGLWGQEEASGRYRLPSGCIEGIAHSDIERAGKHRDGLVVRMEMRHDLQARWHP
jgi:hypothetical protein